MAFRGLSLANGSTLHQRQKGELLAERINHPSSRRLPHLYRQTLPRRILGEYLMSVCVGEL